MSSTPSDLKYTKDHEWIRIGDDGTAVVGITDYAQESLGDITFVELPAEGDSFQAGDVFGVVESVKAASDLFLPVEGEIVEANTDLDEAPETLNSDPYGAGWIIKVRIENADQLKELLSAEDYEALI